MPPETTRKAALSRVAIPFGLFLSLLAVAGARFNRRGYLGWILNAPPAGAEPWSDAVSYIDVVRWFRGEATQYPLTTPFVHRPLAPLLAAALPFAPMTALNVVNLLALAGSAVCLYLAMRAFGADRRLGIAGAAIFIFSFPCFYYGTIGYVDPVLLFFLTAFVLGASRRSAWRMVTALLLGTCSKETMALALPSYFAAVGKRGAFSGFRRISLSLAGLAAVLVPLALVRWLIPFEADRSHSMTLEMVLANARRSRAWLSLALTFGAPGVLATALFLRNGRRARLRSHDSALPLLLGALAYSLLVPASFALAYVDGRPMWTLYPFLIPIIGLMLRGNGDPQRV